MCVCVPRNVSPSTTEFHAKIQVESFVSMCVCGGGGGWTRQFSKVNFVLSKYFNHEILLGAIGKLCFELFLYFVFIFISSVLRQIP